MALLSDGWIDIVDNFFEDLLSCFGGCSNPGLTRAFISEGCTDIVDIFALLLLDFGLISAFASDGWTDIVDIFVELLFGGITAIWGT